MTTNPTDTVMFDAIEHALWQDLADALNRLSEYGLEPVDASEIDAGNVIHGGGARPEGGYKLHQTGTGWTVAARGGAR